MKTAAGQSHHKHIPVKLLFRWLKDADAKYPTEKFCQVAPDRSFITAPAAIAIVNQTCRAVRVSYNVRLPSVLLGAGMPAMISQRLQSFSGAVRLVSVKYPSYRGLKKFIRIKLPVSDVVTLRILGRALGLEQWELCSLLLSGEVINRSHASCTQKAPSH